MSIFRNANHYFALLSKIETSSSVALWTNEREVLTDEELFLQMFAIMKDSYKVDSTRYLSKGQKYDLAKRIYSAFSASQKQIKRVLYLSDEDIETIFQKQS